MLAARARPYLVPPPRLSRLSSAHRLGLSLQQTPSSQRRYLANIRDDKDLHSASSTSSQSPLSSARTLLVTGSSGDVRRPDPRTLQLGKTVQILHDSLPTLLTSPLPRQILSPRISLRLFPSTHPHLPTVSGRIAYAAALWTAPVAWGYVPVVGNVRLIVLSERMVKNGCSDFGSDRLIVKWRTCGKTKGHGMGAYFKGIGGGGNQVDKITEFLGGDERDDEEFTGIFIFDFDEDGRILTHTIEHVEQGKNFEKMTRVISVTDWLLGLGKGRPNQQPGWAFHCCESDAHGDQRSLQRRYGR